MRLTHIALTALLISYTIDGYCQPMIGRSADRVVAPLVDEHLPIQRRYQGVWVGVITKDQTFSKGYGHTAVGKDAPNDKTLFKIGSLTKPMTGTALAILELRKKLDSGSKASDHFPELKSAATILQLATHYSGLPKDPMNGPLSDDDWNWLPMYDKSKLFGFLKKATFEKPGEKWNYSNLAFGILGEITRRQSQSHTYFEALRKLLFAPLGIDDVFVDVPQSQRKRLAQGYQWDGKPVPHWEWSDKSALAGCGSITLSGTSMLQFLKASSGMAEGEVKNAMTLALTPRLPIPDSHEDMGYAWWIFRKNGVAWHTGMTWGYRSVLVVDPTSNVGIAILSNSVLKDSNGKWDKRIDDAAFGILKDLTGKSRD